MTYLKKLPNLTVKEQSGIITDLIVKFFEQHGWTEVEDEGRGILFENPNIDLTNDGDGFQQYDQYIQFNKGYFGANSEPSVLGTWMSGDDVCEEAIEMEKQADVYLTELKKSIL